MDIPFRVIFDDEQEPIPPIHRFRREQPIYTLFAQHDIEIGPHQQIQIDLRAVYTTEQAHHNLPTKLLCMTPDTLIADYGCHCITRVIYSDEVITVWIGNMTPHNHTIRRGEPICDLIEYT